MRLKKIPALQILKETLKHFWVLDFSRESDGASVNDKEICCYNCCSQQGIHGGYVLQLKGRQLPFCVMCEPETLVPDWESLPGSATLSISFHPQAFKSPENPDFPVSTANIIYPTLVGALPADADQENSTRETFQLIPQRHRPKVLAVGKRYEDEVVGYCLHRITACHGMVGVRDLLQECSVSGRQLQRRFQALLGVSPRHFIKAIRVQRALILMKEAREKDFCDIAYELGYADQSHFNRHVKEITGLTPRQAKRCLNNAHYVLVA